MNRILRLLKVLTAIVAVSIPQLQAEEPYKDPPKVFRLRGVNNEGGSRYTGSVALRNEGATTLIMWTTGFTSAVSTGVGLESGKVLGVGTGPSMRHLALFTKDGKRIKAKWTPISKPINVKECDLTGDSEFKGKHSFADGSGWTVDFTPNGDGSYEVSWENGSTFYRGVGIQSGDVMVAASAQRGAGELSVSAMVQKDDEYEGTWAAFGTPGVGKENWSYIAEVSKEEPEPEKEGVPLWKIAPKTFDPLLTAAFNLNYKTCTNMALQFHEFITTQKYTDAVAMLSPSAVAPAERPELAKRIKDSAETVGAMKTFVPDNEWIDVSTNNDGLMTINLRASVEYENGKTYESFYFLRNKAHAFELVNYNREMKNSPPDAASKTAGGSAGPLWQLPVGKYKAELTKVVNADCKLCTAIALKFHQFIANDKPDEAFALMNATAVPPEKRAAAIELLHKSIKNSGALKSFMPDDNAIDFGVAKDGSDYLELIADVEYEHAKLRETFTFFRTKPNVMELFGYDRKEAK